MTTQVPPDLLSRLRHVSNECLRTDYGYSHYQAFKAELSAERVLALVACVEALQLSMAILKHEALDKIAVIRALDKGRDALANLEVL